MRWLIAAFSILTLIMSASAQSSDWETCNQSSARWADKIAACLSVIDNETDHSRLAVAHYQVAENLAKSYHAYKLTGLTKPCRTDNGRAWTFQRERLCMHYDPLGGLSGTFDPAFCDSVTVRNIVNPTTKSLDIVLAEYDKALRYDPDFAPAVRDRARAGNRCAPPRNVNAQANAFRTLAAKAQQNVQNGEHDQAFANLSTLMGMPEFKQQDATFRGKVLVMRGLSAYALRDLESSIADLDRAVAIWANAEPYNRRGLVRLQRGDTIGALDDFNSAISLQPSPQMHMRRAQLYFQNRAFSASISDWGKAIESKSISPELRTGARLQRAMAHHQVGAVEPAITDYRAVFGALNSANLATRTNANEIVDALRRSGLYQGDGSTFDTALEAAFRQCVAAPQCRLYEPQIKWADLEISGLFPPPPPGWSSAPLAVSRMTPSSTDLANEFGLGGLMKPVQRLIATRTYRRDDSELVLRIDTEDFETAGAVDAAAADDTVRKQLAETGVIYEPRLVGANSGLSMKNEEGRALFVLVGRNGVASVACAGEHCPADMLSVLRGFRWDETERFVNDDHQDVE